MTQAQQTALAKICQKMIHLHCWCEFLDGGDLQDEAVRLGILEPRTVTAEMLEEGGVCHNADADFDIGGTAYFFADWVLENNDEHESD